MPDQIDELIQEMRAWIDERLILSSRSVPELYRKLGLTAPARPRRSPMPNPSPRPGAAFLCPRVSC